MLLLLLSLLGGFLGFGTAFAASPPATVISNGFISVRVGADGLERLEDLRSGAAFLVESDAFALAGATSEGAAWRVNSAGSSFAALHTAADNSSVSVRFDDAAQGVAVTLSYTLFPREAFVRKSVTATGLVGRGFGRLRSVSAFDGALFRCAGAEWNSSFVPDGHAAAFLRCSASGSGSGSNSGVLGAPSLFLSQQNPFASYSVQPQGGAYNASAGYHDASPRALLDLELEALSGELELTLDGAVLGVLALRRGPGQWLRQRSLSAAAPPPAPAVPPQALNAAERDAMVQCVRSFLLENEHRQGQEPPGQGQGDAAQETVKVVVGWDSNDFQIDTANVTQRVEYTRLIERAAEFGARHLVFAPINTELANGDLFSNRQSLLEVGWEAVLWAALGTGVRNGSVAPSAAWAALPPSQRELLSLARDRGVLPMAYVYPIIVGFDPNGTVAPHSAPWLYPSSNPHLDRTIHHSDLGHPLYQRWLARALVDFYDALGLGGYAFDGMFFGEAGANSSAYAQWRGWQRTLRAFKRERPAAVIDNRLSAHALGPWGQLIGTYSEPIAGDENPETYAIPVPSLRTDHIAADNLRRVNFWYRDAALFPMERVPGFAFHQSERSAPPPETTVDVCSNQSAGGFAGCYRRDFDLLGYRYSLLSQVATAGLNNVMTMLPARDEDEYRYFPAEDRAFVRAWLAFGDAPGRAAQLRNTLPLPDRNDTTAGGEVGVGAVDGSAAFAQPLSCAVQALAAAGAVAESGWSGDRELGHVFLFNPGPAATNASFVVDDTLSPFDDCLRPSAAATERDAAGAAGVAVDVVVVEVYPLANRTIAVLPGEGGFVVVPMSGSSAAVVRVALRTRAVTAVGAAAGVGTVGAASRHTTTRAELLGAAGSAWLHANGTLVVQDMRGEAGSQADVSIVLPADDAAPAVKTVEVRCGESGATLFRQRRPHPHQLPPQQPGALRAESVGRVRFGGMGAAFPHSAQLSLQPNGTGPNGTACFGGDISVPVAVAAQLRARAATYNVSWTVQDADAAWLRPARLLLFAFMKCGAGAGASKAPECQPPHAVPANRMLLTMGSTTLPTLDAYNTRCASCNRVNRPFSRQPSQRYTGQYWDVSAALDANTSVRFCLSPALLQHFGGMFFENVEPIYADAHAIEFFA